MAAYSTFTDLELLLLLKQGDQRVYDQIFIRFYSPLCFFAESIVGNSYRAEDIAQEAMVKLWHSQHDFHSFESLRSFLYVCVRNSCFNELEKMKVRSKYQNDLLQGGIQAESTILESLMQAEVVGKLYLAVDTLPEQCRKVILMTFSDGKTPKEIADELKVSISTINNQKMRGIILLRKRLSNDDLNTAMALLLSGVNLFFF